MKPQIKLARDNFERTKLLLGMSLVTFGLPMSRYRKDLIKWLDNENASDKEYIKQYYLSGGLVKAYTKRNLIGK